MKRVNLAIIMLFGCFLVWQAGNYVASPNEMDAATSVAVIGFLGTIFFCLL